MKKRRSAVIPPPDIDPSPPLLTVTEAARNFADMVNRAYYRGERFVLTKGGKPVAEIGPVSRRVVRAADVLRALDSMPHLGRRDADRLAADLEAGRRILSNAGPVPWE